VPIHGDGDRKGRGDGLTDASLFQIFFRDFGFAFFLFPLLFALDYFLFLPPRGIRLSLSLCVSLSSYLLVCAVLWFFHSEIKTSSSKKYLLYFFLGYLCTVYPVTRLKAMGLVEMMV
jgi:hypothetical protein